MAIKFIFPFQRSGSMPRGTAPVIAFIILLAVIIALGILAYAIWG